jgi:N-acetylglucosamine kinase-like BadF-type ATPase
MILIIESGATKTDWCAVKDQDTQVNVRTAGMNLSVMAEPAIERIVNDAIEKFKNEGICFPEDSEVHFYAAGLIVPDGEKVPESAKGLNNIFRRIFPNGEIEYASDLLDAARAVCGHSAGIAAILGTGSNSCFYDGRKIVKNVRAGGFILGDEGGGARLGRIFLSDYIKGLMPEEISNDFYREFGADYMNIVANVYRGEAPSKYLGSFAPWILDRYDGSEYIREIVDGNFKDFIERALKQYDIEKYPVGVVGGFGYAHRAIFMKVASAYGINVSKIIAAPIEGLVEYHLTKD